MKYFYLFLFPLLFACSKQKDTDNYTAYYPDLMALDIIRDSPYIGGPRMGEYETQMEIVGDVLFILDRGNGVHALLASSKRRALFCISPGASYMLPNGNGISVDRTVDLARFGKSGIQTVGYLGASLNILNELMPPDGKNIPPIFKRDRREKNTEIIRWEK